MSFLKDAWFQATDGKGQEGGNSLQEQALPIGSGADSQVVLGDDEFAYSARIGCCFH